MRKCNLHFLFVDDICFIKGTIDKVTTKKRLGKREQCEDAFLRKYLNKQKISKRERDPRA